MGEFDTAVILLSISRRPRDAEQSDGKRPWRKAKALVAARLRKQHLTILSP